MSQTDAARAAAADQRVNVIYWTDGRRPVAEFHYLCLVVLVTHRTTCIGHETMQRHIIHAVLSIVITLFTPSISLRRRRTDTGYHIKNTF